MSLDVSLSVADCWFRLGFLNAGELSSTSWVTPAELYQFADDAVKGLARSTALFLSYDQSTNVVAGTPQYGLPANHVFTEGAWLIYSAPAAVQLLRLTGATQLHALDATWPATSGAPTRLSMDAANLQTGTLYPNPVANAVLAMIFEPYPPDVTASAHVLPVTGILQDAVSYAMLAGALGKESDNSRPEVAKHCQERMALYLAIVNKLWGVD